MIFEKIVVTKLSHKKLRAIACLNLRFDACVTDAQFSGEKEKASGRSRYRFASLLCTAKRGGLWDFSKDERSSYWEKFFQLLETRYPCFQDCLVGLFRFRVLTMRFSLAVSSTMFPSLLQELFEVLFLRNLNFFRKIWGKRLILQNLTTYEDSFYSL